MTEGEYEMKKMKFLAAAFCLLFCLMAAPNDSFAITIKGKAEPLGQVLNVKAGICTQRSVNIHWTPVAGATGYEIYRATARNGRYTLLKNLPGTSQAFMNTSVLAGKEYFFKIRAFKYSSYGKTNGKFSKILRTNTKPLYSRKVRAKYNVNIRKYAGTNYPRIFGVYKGTKMTVLCETCDKTGAKWYRIQVKLNGKKKKGYVRSDLVL